MPSSSRVNTVLCLSSVEFLTECEQVTNFRVIYASNSQRANEVLGSTVVDALVVLLPVTISGTNELLRDFRARAPKAPILVYEPTVTPQGGSELMGLSTCEHISGPMPAGEL